MDLNMEIFPPNSLEKPAEINSPLPFELALLKQSVNYQKWVMERIHTYLGDVILEVGAGIGNMSQRLPVDKKLILTEADPQLYQILAKDMPPHFEFKKDLEISFLDLSHDWTKDFEHKKIDTIVSFNVLEHIEDDFNALTQFYSVLSQSKTVGKRRIITFVPAHNWAFGEIDKNFLHHRRYDHHRLTKMFRKISPEAKVFYRYFNLPGLFSWFVMGRLFKKSSFGTKAARTFESLCPMIKPMDNFVHDKLRLPFGQSLLFIVEIS